MAKHPTECKTVEACVEAIIDKVGKKIVLGIPLGLGKPNQLVNALYNKAKANPDIKLKIFTALSLEKPTPANDIEARFLEPFVERMFGNYPELEYMSAIRKNTLPSNITVSEFYFKAGAMKKVANAQRNYISTNYTFVARDMIENGVNVLTQMVAEKELDGSLKFSLSSNTDVTLDLIPLLQAERDKGRQIVTVAQVHADLPFMYNRAVVDPGYFDMVVRNPQYNTTLFAPPNMTVPPQDFMAGFHASTLIKDGGTLQIGIGSLGDAIVYACKLRHEHNEVYQTILKHLGCDNKLVERFGGLKPFKKGLYGSSEMFVNGFMHLIKAGIVKRKVYDSLPLQKLLNKGAISEKIDDNTLAALIGAEAISPQLTKKDVSYLTHWGVFKPTVEWVNGKLRCDNQEYSTDLSDTENLAEININCLGDRLKKGIYMHGGFFLGPRDFYQTLKDMSREESENICMSSVGHINQLSYDTPLLTEQRIDARFINTGMIVTLSGAVVSDGLQEGTVVSGVGGQYNFVAMAHALPDARSILCVRATRGEGKDTKSNIVPFYGHITIPRHLRDIIVTEYGVADLRGKSDEQIVKALLSVADSRFQEELLAFAKENNKIDPGYEIPKAYRNNTPERILKEIGHWRAEGFFPVFPLGCDFTDEELAIGKSLKEIKALMGSPKRLVKAVIKAFVHDVDEKQAKHFLERMKLEHPDTAKETLIQHLFLLELEENGYLKPL